MSSRARVCRAALEAMAAGHFDADSEACVMTLARVVDNVVHRPDVARTRQIRCGNAAFQQKVRLCVCVCEYCSLNRSVTV